MTESKTMTELHPDDIAMSFKNLSISSLVPPKPILSNISGFVKKGGITASKWFFPLAIYVIYVFNYVIIQITPTQLSITLINIPIFV